MRHAVRRLAAPLLLALGALGAVGALAAPARAQAPQGPPAPEADAGLGTVADREGTAARRAAGDARWGPVAEGDRLRPGDWLKTGSRGANALAVSLGVRGELVLGPGATVEVRDGGGLVLHQGELLVAPRPGVTLAVAGPKAARRDVAARTVLRAKGDALEALAEDPRWLVGYQQQAPTEAVGSLLATVDGRNVPITLGYHAVQVDIRDGLARTTIEERFVNRTGAVLEGVFYFPLPADASISSFGMWIGDELVHGEIVEKERARAIYEEILREKRDPGLLEWAGGSIFKARIYPIGAEKRIQLGYTQVLAQTRRPDGTCAQRYTHALQSELLRATPLERLEVRVTVASERPLVDVRSPSHTARVELTPHAASLELSREGFAPDRDFELEVVTRAPAGGPAGAGVTAIPHRRGDDGYLMLLVDAPTAAPTTAPAAAEAPGAARDAPLDVLVVADTSGSLLGPARAAQVRFVAALLDALSERDTIDLATVDATTRFAFDRPQACTAAAREAALGALEARRPLGWTDLDQAFAALDARVGPATHVVYVGDGAVTTGDGDAGAFARRLAARGPGRGTFHAVVPGTTQEPLALRAIAARGGGTLRTLDAGDPARAAFELLAEVTAPAVRDLAVRFEGLEVAAVHPDALPSLPLGAQHVVVARWDARAVPPGGGKGRVVVAGRLGGAPFEVATDVALPAVEAGNSFVPRLWARQHLDHLLARGASAETKARVIALSEEFQLVTPYTSFLVLETDADRERFAVRKTTRLRDGEEFFAEGQARAGHALARAQAQRARSWRLELEARALAALRDLDRGLTGRLGGGATYADGPVGYALHEGGRGGGGMRLAEARSAAPAPLPVGKAGADEGGADDAPAGDADGDAADGEPPAEPAPGDDASSTEEAPPAAVEQELKQRNEAFAGPAARRSQAGLVAGEAVARQRWRRAPAAPGLFLGDGSGLVPARPGLAPDVPGSPWDGLLPGPGGPRGDVAWTGSAAGVAALRALDRRAWVAARDGGLRVTTRTSTRDPRGRLRERGEGRWLLGRDAWATLAPHRDGEDARLEWLAPVAGGGPAERGALGLAWALGRVRPAEAGDAAAWPAPYAWAFGDEAAGLAGWAVDARAADGGRLALVFTPPDAPADARALTLEVDVARGLATSATWAAGGAPTSAVRWADPVEVAGAWWPRTETVTDAAGVVVRATTIAVEALEPAALAAALAEALAPRAQATLLGAPPATLEAARRAAAAGAARLEDRWALLGALAAAQRWEEAAPHQAALEAALAGRPGLVRLRAAWLQASRRGEELAVHLLAAARDLAAAPRPGDAAAALELLEHGRAVGQGQELLDLLAALGPTLERRAALEDVRVACALQRAGALRAADRPDEAVAALRALAAALPERVDVVTTLAWQLAADGDAEAGVQALDEALARRGPWPLDERRALLGQLSQLLWAGQRLDAFVERFEALERDAPEVLDQGLCGRLLAALVMLDREAQTWARCQAWARAPLPDGEAPPALRARLGAAVAYCLGQGEGLWGRRVEDDHAALAVEVARRTAAHPALSDLAQAVVGHWQVMATDAGRALAAELFAGLRRDAGALAPGALLRLVTLCQRTTAATEATVEAAGAWRAVFATAYARWEAAHDAGDAAAEGPLAQVVDAAGDAELRLRRLRRVLARAEAKAGGDAAATRDAAAALLGALLDQPWSAERAAEAAPLLARTGPRPADAEPLREARLDAQVVTLVALVDWTTDGRADAVVAARPDVNTLPRRRLAAVRAEALRAARGEAAEALRALPTDGALAAWVQAERAWLLVRLGRRDEARALAGAQLARSVTARTAPAAPPTLRDQVLAARALATLVHLLATDAPEARAAHLAAVVDAVAAGVAADDRLLDWREAALVVRLVTRDLPGLEAALAAWVAAGRPADADAAVVAEAQRWARPLAWVLAERDALAPACEVVADLDRRGAADHADLRLLVDWRVALDQREAADAARRRSWDVAGEWELARALQGDVGRVARRGEGVPEPLDPEAPLRVAALLRKATYPQQHAWVVLQLYQTTRDHRVLAGLAEGVVGQSAERVYDLLAALRPLTDALQEEAAVDALVARLGALRAAAAEVDRRALCLLEVAVRRKAAEQRQGAGPHLEAALAALREASKATWRAGEPARYAAWLADQGALPGPLGAEQLLQLEGLVGTAAAGTLERLDLAAALARAQAAHGRREEAVRTLTGAVTQVRQAAARPPQAGCVPPSRWGHVEALVGLLQALGDWRGAEAQLEVELGASPCGSRPSRGAARSAPGAAGPCTRRRATTSAARSRSAPRRARPPGR